MDIYTFVGIVAIVVFTITGIIFIATKCLAYAAYAVEQANKRAHQVYLRKEKEECEKCLAELYKD